MENQKEKSESKFGNVSFGEVSKLLIDIIGQNVILKYASKGISNEKEAKKKQKALARKLEEMYNGHAVYQKFATAEPESPQWYIAQFFEEVLEKEYGFHHLAMIIVDSFTWQLFFALRCTTPFEKTKKETALFLIRKELFNLIHDLIQGKKDDESNTYKVSKEAVFDFLTDNYDKVFSEINKKIPYDNNQTRKAIGAEKIIEKSMENKKTLHGKIENFYDDNADDYPRLDVPEYKQNIYNWRKGDHNPTWDTLEPIFDLLKEKGEISLLHRLIKLYLRKNAQKAMQEIMDIHEAEEQEKIITDIRTMIIENKNPEEFYNENDFVFYELPYLINMCLVYQQQEDFNVVKNDAIISAIEKKCDNSKKFFSPWLKARARVFEKKEAIKNSQEVQSKIIEDYKSAFNEGGNFAGAYLEQFLIEAIVINIYCNPSQMERGTKDYYGYGYALEQFEADKQKLIDFIKATKNTAPGDDFKDIHYSCNPWGKLIPLFYPNLQSKIEFINEAISINNKGLEFDKAGDFESAIQCFSKAIMLNPVYVNAYSNRGNLLLKKMDDFFTENALADFNITLLLDPEHQNTLFNRGLLFLQRHQLNEALADFTALINLNPRDAGAYLNRAIVYTLMGDIDKAQEDKRKAGNPE